MTIDWSLCRTAPYAHQKEGVLKLLQNRAFALFDEVGCGKTKQPIDAAGFLYRQRVIDTVLVVAPASVRSVWLDPDPVLGEVAKHVWVPHYLAEYHAKHAQRTLRLSTTDLLFVVTNYEFLRRAERLDPLIEWASRRKVMLVLDESWMVANPRAQQTKALVKLRQACDRVVILNGTPGDPMAVFSQYFILDPSILGFRNAFSFRNHYAVMGGFKNKEIVGWQHMEKFQRKIAPYALRRRTHECIDLPPVSYMQIEAALTPTTWTHYTALRDELVTWLSKNEVCTAEQAGVRVLRLAQVTAGFLGGVQALQADLLDGHPNATGIREIGREKLDALLAWLEQHWAKDKALVFTRFRADVERTASALELHSMCTSMRILKLYGQQDPAEREAAKRLLAPGGDPTSGVVVGNAASGGAGLNFAASNLCVFLANDFSLKTRKQAEGRVDRPGQTRHVTYLDVIATGPNGERTIDHTIVKALRQKQDLSDTTAAAWRRALVEETGQTYKEAA